MQVKHLILILIGVAILTGLWFFINRDSTISIEIPPPLEEEIEEVIEIPEVEENPDIAKLFTKPWSWAAVLYNDGTEIIPKNSGKFVLTFQETGTFSASTDCNGIGGTYKINGTELIFSDMVSTLMFCEFSQETEFKNILENTASFFFTPNGELILELKFDSGTATFR